MSAILSHGIQTNSQEYVCSVVADAQGLHALRDEWTDLLLASRRPNVFLSWEWMTVWMETVGQRGAPHVLLLRRAKDGVLTGLAPLYRLSSRNPLGLKVITFMGKGVGADHFAFISRPGTERAVSEGIVGYLLSSLTWDVLDFPRMEEEQAALVASAASKWAGGSYTCVRTPADLCPFVPLPRTWDDYLRIIGKDNRTELARQWRRTREQGQVAIQRVQTVAELEHAWSVLLRLHQARRDAAGERSAFLEAPSSAFHEGFLRVALDRGWLRLYVLLVNGHGVAANYCLSMGGLISFVQAGFDIAWSRYGVGTLLLGHAIEEAIAEGASEFDLLRGAETYKLHNWAAQLRRDVSLVVHGHRPRVRLAMAARRWGSAVKPVLRRHLRVSKALGIPLA